MQRLFQIAYVKSNYAIITLSCLKSKFRSVAKTFTDCKHVRRKHLLS